MLKLDKIKLVDTDGKFSLYSRKPYLHSYRGNIYDPEDHIAVTDKPLEECMMLAKMDRDFALYLNCPVYKIEYLEPDEYIYNTRTGNVYYDKRARSKTEYYYRLFDENFNRLDTPVKDIDDGYLVKEKGLLDWME